LAKHHLWVTGPCLATVLPFSPWDSRPAASRRPNCGMIVLPTCIGGELSEQLRPTGRKPPAFRSPPSTRSGQSGAQFAPTPRVALAGQRKAELCQAAPRPRGPRRGAAGCPSIASIPATDQSRISPVGILRPEHRGEERSVLGQPPANAAPGAGSQATDAPISIRRPAQDRTLHTLQGLPAFGRTLLQAACRGATNAGTGGWGCCHPQTPQGFAVR